MTFSFPRVAAAAVAFVVAVVFAVPVHAQQAQMSDGGGVQISDVSGANYNDQGPTSEEARLRVQSVAAALSQAVRGGQVPVGASTVSVPRHVVNLLTDRKADAATRTETIAALTDGGLSEARAIMLVDAVTKLLAQEPVSVPQFVSAVHALNGAVDGASEDFLANPPAEFLAMHAVLTQLLAAAS